jgi:hypothetical protein
VLFARESFFLRGSRNLPVANKACCAVVVKCGYSENIHMSPVLLDKIIPGNTVLVSYGGLFDNPGKFQVLN